MFLCYWSWLKKPKYWQQGDTTAANETTWAIRQMLTELINLWPRDQGNGWFKPKVHEQLHIPGDIQRNGSPRNSYSGTVEHNHVNFKNASKRTQQRRHILDKQIGDRCAETHIVDYCYSRMMASEMELNKNTIDLKQTNNSEYGTKGLLTFNRDNNNNAVTYTMVWSTKTTLDADLPTLAIAFLEKEFKQSLPRLCSKTYKIVTEHQREGQVFRAHPLYRSKQAWHDWCMFRFAKEDGDNKDWHEATFPDNVHFGDDDETANQCHYAPGKILAFVQQEDDSVDAIVLGCHYRHKQSSPISTHWKIQYEDAGLQRPYVNYISVDSIVRHCLMIPENDELNGYHEIWERELWAESFV
jgi:hypothetical protein